MTRRLKLGQTVETRPCTLALMDSAAWDERYSAAHHHLWGIEPNRFVREQCESMTPGDAIDVACGEGRNALWLAGLGWRVTGVDFSPVAIAGAERLTEQLDDDARQRVSWRVEDVTELRLPADSLDLVLIAYIHVLPDDHDRMVRNLTGALRSGGHLLVVGHDTRNLAEGVSGPQDLERLYDPNHIAALAREGGLVVDLADTVERPTADGVALDCLVRAHRPEPGSGL